MDGFACCGWRNELWMLVTTLSCAETSRRGRRFWCQKHINPRTGSPFMNLNDTTDYQRCFACGQRNPYGIQMVFRLEDNTIVSDFSPREEHQGFPGMVHGGIVAVV